MKIRNTTNILMELRKICQHPYLSAPEMENLSAPDERQHKELVQSSGKLAFLKILLPKLKAKGHRVLLFSQFKIALDRIQDFLYGEGYAFLRLDGDAPQAQRQKDMDAFNAPDSEFFIFLLTTRAGGVGINLATADTVIVYDPDFNPHQDLQAIARSHRYGQNKKVLVFKLMTKDSVEEKIIQSGKRKMVLDHLVVQNLGKDAGDEADIDTMLTYGAKALYDTNDDGTSAHDVTYTSKQVDEMLEKVEKEADDEAKIMQAKWDKEDSMTDEERLAAMNNRSIESMDFSFAKIWETDRGDLGEVDVEAEMDDDAVEAELADELQLLHENAQKSRERKQAEELERNRKDRRKNKPDYYYDQLEDTPKKKHLKSKGKGKERSTEMKATQSSDSEFFVNIEDPSGDETDEELHAIPENLRDLVEGRLQSVEVERRQNQKSALSSMEKKALRNKFAEMAAQSTRAQGIIAEGPFTSTGIPPHYFPDSSQSSTGSQKRPGETPEERQRRRVARREEKLHRAQAKHQMLLQQMSAAQAQHAAQYPPGVNGLPSPSAPTHHQNGLPQLGTWPQTTAPPATVPGPSRNPPPTGQPTIIHPPPALRPPQAQLVSAATVEGAMAQAQVILANLRTDLHRLGRPGDVGTWDAMVFSDMGYVECMTLYWKLARTVDSLRMGRGEAPYFTTLEVRPVLEILFNHKPIGRLGMSGELQEMTIRQPSPAHSQLQQQQQQVHQQQQLQHHHQQQQHQVQQQQQHHHHQQQLQQQQQQHQHPHQHQHSRQHQPQHQHPQHQHPQHQHPQHQGQQHPVNGFQPVPAGPVHGNAIASGSAQLSNLPMRQAPTQAYHSPVAGPSSNRVVQQSGNLVQQVPQHPPIASPHVSTQRPVPIRPKPSLTLHLTMHGPAANASASHATPNGSPQIVRPPPSAAVSTFDPHPLNPLPQAAPRKLVSLSSSRPDLASSGDPAPGTSSPTPTETVQPQPKPLGIAPTIARPAAVPTSFSTRISPSRPSSTSSRQSTPVPERFPLSVTSIAPRPSPTRPTWATINRPAATQSQDQPQVQQQPQQQTQPQSQQQQPQQSQSQAIPHPHPQRQPRAQPSTPTQLQQQEQQRQLLPMGRSRPSSGASRQSEPSDVQPHPPATPTGNGDVEVSAASNPADPASVPVSVPAPVDIETLRKDRDALTQYLKSNLNRPPNVRQALEKRLADVTSQLMIREDLARRAIHPSYAAHLNMVPHQDQQFGDAPGPAPTNNAVPYPTPGPGPQPHLAPSLPPLPRSGAVPFIPVIQGTEGRSKDTAIAIDDEDDSANEDDTAAPGFAGSSNGPMPTTNTATASMNQNGDSGRMQVDQVHPEPSAHPAHPVVTTHAATLAQSQQQSPSSVPAPASPFQPAPAPTAIPTPGDSPAPAQAATAQTQVTNGTTNTSIPPPTPPSVSTPGSASTADSITRPTCPICGPTQPHSVQDCSLYRAGPERLQGLIDRREPDDPLRRKLEFSALPRMIKYIEANACPMCLLPSCRLDLKTCVVNHGGRKTLKETIREMDKKKPKNEDAPPRLVKLYECYKTWPREDDSATPRKKVKLDK